MISSATPEERMKNLFAFLTLAIAFNAYAKPDVSYPNEIAKKLEAAVKRNTFGALPEPNEKGEILLRIVGLDCLGYEDAPEKRSPECLFYQVDTLNIFIAHKTEEIIRNGHFKGLPGAWSGQGMYYSVPKMDCFVNAKTKRTRCSPVDLSN
jgi:hypothetical protein